MLIPPPCACLPTHSPYKRKWGIHCVWSLRRNVFSLLTCCTSFPSTKIKHIYKGCQHISLHGFNNIMTRSPEKQCQIFQVSQTFLEISSHSIGIFCWSDVIAKNVNDLNFFLIFLSRLFQLEKNAANVYRFGQTMKSIIAGRFGHVDNLENRIITNSLIYCIKKINKDAVFLFTTPWIFLSDFSDTERLLIKDWGRRGDTWILFTYLAQCQPFQIQKGQLRGSLFLADWHTKQNR